MASITAYTKAQADARAATKADVTALAGFLPIPSGGVSTVPGATVPLTRRAAIPVGADASSTAFTTFVDFCMRKAMILPVTTTRWRLGVRNQAPRTGALNAGQVAVAGVHLGDLAYSAIGAWAGNFAAAPTQAFGAFTGNADGSRFLSGWVTDPALQFSAYKPRGVSVGFTVPSGTTVVRGPQAGFLAYGTSGTNASASSAAATLAAGTGGGIAAADNALDWYIEYEYVGANLLCAVVGDSIANGVVANNIGTAQGTTPGPHVAWPNAAGLRQCMTVINMGVGGSTAAEWATTPASNTLWTRFDLTTVVPDIAIVALGYNDTHANASLATFQANITTIVNYLRSLGIPRIYLATVTGGANSVTTLTAAANVGDTSINVAAAQGVNQPITIGQKPTAEVRTPTAQSGTGPYTLTVPALSIAHASGEVVAGSFESLRGQYNDWLRGVPCGVSGVIDMAKRLELPATPWLMDPNAYAINTAGVVQYPHPSAAGYQMMAGEVSVKLA